MIQVSLYYLISSVVVLPGVTFYFTNKYYTNKIDKILKDCYEERKTDPKGVVKSNHGGWQSSSKLREDSFVYSFIYTLVKHWV